MFIHILAGKERDRMGCSFLRTGVYYSLSLDARVSFSYWCLDWYMAMHDISGDAEPDEKKPQAGHSGYSGYRDQKGGCWGWGWVGI